MIQWVYERALQAALTLNPFTAPIVATDDDRIFAAVRAFGGEARMTDATHTSGTDRLAEIAREVVADIYVNIQGDEPLLDPRAIAQVVQLISEHGFEMSTLMAPLASRAELENPSAVKVLADTNRRAIYFSRLPIPYSRQSAPAANFACHHHIGLYAYRRETLLRLSMLSPSPLELAESLEQLRALENGIAIGIEPIVEPADARLRSFGVDTPEDLERVRALLDPQARFLDPQTRSSDRPAPLPPLPDHRSPK